MTVEAGDSSHVGTGEPPRDQHGHEVFGPYLLEGVLGQGGMGQVFRAFDTRRHRVVAIKRMFRHLAADPEFRARFQRESSLAALLHEPHIIPIHDYGEIDGQLFIDMRLVEGHNLAAVLRKHRLTAERVVDIVSQVADALDAAHAEGLVHRDVKPSNILLVGSSTAAAAERGFAYVADFGVASTLGGSTMSRPGLAIGTPAYMAPERMYGDQWDIRVDVYSLACVLFEALARRKPFQGPDLLTILQAHMTQQPPRLSEVRADVAPAFDDIILRGMAKKSADRFSSAGELAAAAHAALVDWTPGPAPDATGEVTTHAASVQSGPTRAAGTAATVPAAGKDTPDADASSPAAASAPTAPPATPAKRPPSAPAQPRPVARPDAPRPRPSPAASPTTTWQPGTLPPPPGQGPRPTAQPEPQPTDTRQPAAAQAPPAPQPGSAATGGGDPGSQAGPPVGPPRTGKVDPPRMEGPTVAVRPLTPAPRPSLLFPPGAAGRPGSPPPPGVAPRPGPPDPLNPDTEFVGAPGPPRSRGGTTRWIAAVAAFGLVLVAAAIFVPRLLAPGSPVFQPVATFPVGVAPAEVALSPDGRVAYVSNKGADTVSVIDTATGAAVVDPVPVGAAPNSVAVRPDSGSQVYVTNTESNQLSIINTADYTVRNVPVGRFPDGLAVAPSGDRVYVGNADDSTVSVIDPVAGKVLGSPIAVGAKPFGMALSPDGGRLFVPNADSDDVTVIDTADRSTVATVPVGDAPIGIAFHPAGDRVYVANRDGGTVSVIDTAALTVVGDPIPVGTAPIGVAISRNGARVYVTARDDNTITVINTADRSTEEPFPAGQAPVAIAVSGDDSRIYVVGENSSDVTVLSTV